jgi:hypothetical protein
MGFPITPHTFEMHGVRHSANAPRLDIVASLVGTLPNPKPLATQTQHLRHEGEMLRAAALVQCRQNFFLCANLNPLPCL